MLQACESRYARARAHSHARAHAQRPESARTSIAAPKRGLNLFQPGPTAGLVDDDSQDESDDAEGSNSRQSVHFHVEMRWPEEKRKKTYKNL